MTRGHRVHRRLIVLIGNDVNNWRKYNFHVQFNGGAPIGEWLEPLATDIQFVDSNPALIQDLFPWQLPLDHMNLLSLALSLNDIKQRQSFNDTILADI